MQFIYWALFVSSRIKIFPGILYNHLINTSPQMCIFNNNFPLDIHMLKTIIKIWLYLSHPFYHLKIVQIFGDNSQGLSQSSNIWWSILVPYRRPIFFSRTQLISPFSYGTMDIFFNRCAMYYFKNRTRVLYFMSCSRLYCLYVHFSVHHMLWPVDNLSDRDFSNSIICCSLIFDIDLWDFRDCWSVWWCCNTLSDFSSHPVAPWST